MPADRNPVPAAAREVTATPGWSPIAIPGRPGWWRHLIDGRQVDLPTPTPPGADADQPAGGTS